MSYSPQSDKLSLELSESSVAVLEVLGVDLLGQASLAEAGGTVRQLKKDNNKANQALQQVRTMG
jgi:hypothetical protein